MSNLLRENPHALSPELFSTFMTLDKTATKRIIEFMIPEHVDIISLSKESIPVDVSPEYQPYVKISAVLDYRKKADIYLSFLNKENSLNGVNILDWLLHFSRDNAGGALPMVLILDESDNYSYDDESKPVEVTTLKHSNHGDTVWTIANLLSDRYPKKYLDIIHDLKETDEGKFKTAFLKDIYHRAYIKADIAGQKKEAYSNWLSDLRKDIEKLGINPNDYLNL